MLTGWFVLLPIVSALAGDPVRVDPHELAALPLLLPAAYFIGLVPALLVGAFDGLLAKRSIGWRAPWCGLFGFAVSFLPLLTSLWMGYLNGPWVLMFGAIGAVPGIVCSWIAEKMVQ